ncbi:MAG: hypothetical protein GX970_13675 [Phyllobacteriaceae bacterium]|nr:hypothetical protein [Phyllobacteriaceae bacterium]
MFLPTRKKLLTTVSACLCATFLTAPATFADGGTGAIDPANLVKFNDRDYRVEYADWVSTDPLSTARVKKIEAGKVSYVDITTTATGTYSTDGLTSAHIRYPGIDVEEVRPLPPSNRFAYWAGTHWVGFSGAGANSLVTVRSSGISVGWN